MVLVLTKIILSIVLHDLLMLFLKQFHFKVLKSNRNYSQLGNTTRYFVDKETTIILKWVLS